MGLSAADIFRSVPARYSPLTVGGSSRRDDGQTERQEDSHNDRGGPLSLLLSSGVLLFAGSVVHLGLGFLAKLVIARALGRIDYGAVSLGVTTMTFLVVIVLVGTDSGVGRFLPRFDDSGRRRGILLSAFGFVVPLSVLVGGGVILGARPIASIVFDDPDITPVFQAFGGAIPLMAGFRLTMGSIRGMQESLPRVAIQNLLLPTARFLLIAVAVVFGFGATGVAWAYTGAFGAVAAVSVVYLFRRTPLFDRTPSETMYRRLLTFSAPLMVTATMNTLLTNIDTVILGMFTTTGDVGVYNVAYPLASFLMVILGSFSFLFMPTISQLHAEESATVICQTYRVVTKWIFVATLPLFLLFVTYPGAVIRGTFGGEYVGGSAALVVLSVGFLSHVVSGPAGDTLTAIGETRLIMVDNIAVTAMNIALNLMLIPRYTYLGAAMATTASYALLNALYLVQLHRRIGVHPFGRNTFSSGAGCLALWLVAVVCTELTVTLGILHERQATLLGVVVFVFTYPVVVLVTISFEGAEFTAVADIADRTGVDLEPLLRFVERFID